MIHVGVTVNNPVCKLFNDMAALLSSSLATVIYYNTCNLHTYVNMALTLLLEIPAIVTLNKKDPYNCCVIMHTCVYLCVSCVVVFFSTTRVPTVSGLLLISSLSPCTTIVFSASYCCCCSVTFDIQDYKKKNELSLCNNGLALWISDF